MGIAYISNSLCFRLFFHLLIKNCHNFPGIAYSTGKNLIDIEYNYLIAFTFLHFLPNDV